MSEETNDNEKPQHNPLVKPDIPPEVAARIGTPKTAGEAPPKFDLRSNRGKRLAAEYEAQQAALAAMPVPTPEPDPEPTPAPVPAERVYTQAEVNAMVRMAQQQQQAVAPVVPFDPSKPAAPMLDPFVALIAEYTLATGKELSPYEGTKTRDFYLWMQKNHPQEATVLYAKAIVNYQE
jgi:hypothetical protein